MVEQVTTELSGRAAVVSRASSAPRVPGVRRFEGRGVSTAPRPVFRAVCAGMTERQLPAPAAAAVRADAYALESNATTGAGTANQIFGQQKTQLHPMWALRGLKPWSDPA